MERSARPLPSLAVLGLLAVWSLWWGVSHAWTDSADLLRRAEEMALFVQGHDPFDDPDMTYPPTALPVFAPLVAPFGTSTLKAVWIALNLLALAVLSGAIVAIWGTGWPSWLKVTFWLVAAASKPVRAGIALGQFHLIPTCLVLLSVLALRERRPFRAGLLLGIALAKPTMVLPILGYWVVRREWRALATALGVQRALLRGVPSWLGLGPVRLLVAWLANARTQLAAGTIDLPTLIPRVWPGLPVSAGSLSLVVLGTCFAATFALRRASEDGLVGLCLFFAGIFTYHRHYDLVVLLPALAYLIEASRKANGRSMPTLGMGAIAFAALLIVPSHPAPLARFAPYYDAAFVILSYMFLGVVLVLLRRETRPHGGWTVGQIENPEVAGRDARGLALRL